MYLPESFLDEFDLSIQHGSYGQTQQLIETRLNSLQDLELQLSKRQYGGLEPQQLVDYFIVKSAEAEFMIETGNVEESNRFTQKYLDQLDDVITHLEGDTTGSNQILRDYLEFARTEFLRTLMDVNRRNGDMEQVDRLLSEIDQIREGLCIPRNNPRYIKSGAYNRNYRAIQMWNYGKPDEAKRLFKRCIDDFSQLSAPADVAMIYNNLGLAYLMQGKFHGAIDYFRKSLDYFEQSPNTHLVATLLNNMGEAYREIGDIPKSLSYHQKTLELRKSLGNETDIGQSYLFLGSLYKSQGRLNDALVQFVQSLEIYKKIGHDLNIARLLFSIGEVYQDRGEFPHAEAYYRQSIEYLQQSSNPVILADSHLGTGIIQREKGNYEQALTNLQQAADLREMVGNQPLLGIVHCEMVECYVLQGEMERAAQLLTKIKEVMNRNPEHKILYISYRLAQGIYHQHSKRMRDKVQAEDDYRHILDQPVIPYMLEVRTTKQLLELLLEELHNYGEKEVLLELVDYLDLLEELAKSQSLLVIQVEIYLIRHQLQLLLGTTGDTSQGSQYYLDKAKKIIDSLDIPILSKKLEQVVTFYNRNEQVWTNIDQLNLSLVDRLNLSIVSSSLQNSRQLLHLYQQHSSTPIMIMVFSDGGIISFSYLFSSYRDKASHKINPHLIASFISALNSFGRDTFETTELLETLNYGEHKLISRRIDSYIISLLYAGTNLQVHQQLVEFELFLKESGILDFIQDHPRQEVSLKQDQKEIIEQIFS